MTTRHNDVRRVYLSGTGIELEEHSKKSCKMIAFYAKGCMLHVDVHSVLLASMHGSMLIKHNKTKT